MSEATQQTPKPQPRIITDHQVPGAQQLNNELVITAVDEPGSGGAHHEYEIGVRSVRAGNPTPTPTRITFQNGPLQEVDPNGISNEALLAIVIDRLRCFQNGPFKCDENAKALAMAEHSLAWLKRRTEDRLKRGVEGKSVK